MSVTTSEIMEGLFHMSVTTSEIMEGLFNGLFNNKEQNSVTGGIPSQRTIYVAVMLKVFRIMTSLCSAYYHHVQGE